MFDAWSLGMTVALVAIGAGILVFGWRYYGGGDARRDRRQARRNPLRRD